MNCRLLSSFPQVMRLREHEMAWAERTASEMSLRSEMCAVKDDLSRVSVDNAALKKRCDMLQRENAELGERCARVLALFLVCADRFDHFGRVCLSRTQTAAHPRTRYASTLLCGEVHDRGRGHDRGLVFA